MLTSRTFWTSWVSVTTSANRCRPRPCKRVRRATKVSQDWVQKIDELTTDALDIAFAVHEVSKTLAQTSEDCDDLAGIFWERQKLGINVRKSNDPEHLDAYTDADWSGDPTNRKKYHGWNTQDRFSNVERIHEGLSNVIERRERVLRLR